jgi:hypothetical protein
MTPTPTDYCAAACADALVEGLTLHALQCAHDVARSPEEFFWAVQASVRLHHLARLPKRGE